MNRVFPLAAALPPLLLTACGSPAIEAPPGNEAADNAQIDLPAPLPARAPDPAAAAAAAPATDVKLAEKTDLIEFSYAWPGVADAIPTLDARFRADARTRRQRALNGARQDRAAREGVDFPFHPHGLDTTWTVDGDIGRLLSLRGETYSFTGGAHGNTGWEYLLWDRAANRDITPMSLFRDPVAAEALLKRAFCPALNAERAKKRGAPVPPPTDGEDWLNACPDMMKQVLVLSDPQEGRFTAMRVLIGPYEAGPYAEGSYEVRLPVTPALVALLKPERSDLLAPPR